VCINYPPAFHQYTIPTVQLEVLRQRRPPPNASIIKLLNDFLQCKLAMQLWSESTRYFFENPVNPDFGLPTPESRRWSGLSPKFIPLVPGPCPTPPINFVKICSQLFQLSNGQTDRQTDQSKNIISFSSGGNDDIKTGTFVKELQ